MPNSYWHLAVNILGAIYDSRSVGHGKGTSFVSIPDWKVVTRPDGQSLDGGSGDSLSFPGGAGALEGCALGHQRGPERISS